MSPFQPNQERPDVNDQIVVDLDSNITLELVLIPPGEFMMGSPESEYYPAAREKPPSDPLHAQALC